jgi:sugar phosphate isomerase/epimerase
MDFGRVLKLLSYHVVYDSSILDSIEFAHKNGFSGVQIAIESPHLSFENISDAEITKIKERSEELGIRITLHGPDNLSLLCSNVSLCNGIISYYSELFAFAKRINAEILTMHLGSPETFPTDAASPEIFPKQDVTYYKDALSKNLDKLISLSVGKIQLCIENYLLYDFILNVIQEKIKKNAYLCWDIPKTYNKDGSINREINNFFMKNLPSVKQVHLHNIRDGHSHTTIERGLIDFCYYLKILKDVDVLDYCIEVRPREKAIESLNNLKKILLKCQS